MTNEVVEQQLFYTEEEIQAKITTVVENMTQAHTHDMARKSRQLQAYAQEAVRGMRGEVDEDTLIAVYNAIAEAVGWETLTALTKQYAVAVSYKGYTIAEFSDVEANDEDEACNLVLENMDTEASINITISYEGHSDSADIDIDSWDLDTDEFTAEAEEQA